MFFKLLCVERCTETLLSTRQCRPKGEAKRCTATWLIFHLKICCDCVILSKYKDGKMKLLMLADSLYELYAIQRKMDIAQYVERLNF